MERYFILKTFTHDEADICKRCNLQEVVRCKDCKHGGMDSTSYPKHWCSAHSEYHEEDWFCADGEHK